MADKRISQLIERVDIANNDVLPIVASGATTTNKVTVSTLQDWMQDNLDVGVTSVGITIGSTGTDVNVTGSPVTSSGNITINIPTASATNRGLLSSADWTTFNNKVSSVGLSMPSAFSVANSPITGSGTIAVTGAGTVAQYIRGDGSLADFPSGGGGGGASVNYYLNGSVSQGTIGGIAYQEMNKTPVLGAGTDFVAIADGYLASFITDAGDPGLLEIPGGNWNFETYFSASSGGGTPTFYVELYKVNSGGTATLIASNSGTPELIAFGTTITPYFSTLAVPTTALAITDRLALRYYVARSGRTITMHTENSHLCQIITTFTTGLTALNGLTAQVQNFATGTSGTDFGISSSVSTHTFNLPTASASNRGALSSADWTTFNNKQNALTNPVTGTGVSGRVALWNGTNSINSDADLLFNGTELNVSGIKIDGSSIPYIISNLAGNDLNIQFPVGQGLSINNNGAENIARISKNNLLLSGASTIQTSTGNLTLSTAAGNGNIVLNAHGDGNVTTNDSIYIGSTSGIDHSGISNKLSVASTGYNLLDITKFSNDNFGGYFYIGKSRGSTVGDYTIVQNGDQLGSIIWQGSIGTQFQPAAVISAEVDGVPGSSSDMPGRLIFATCSDNSTFAVERLRIASTGAATFSSNVGIGVTPSAWDSTIFRGLQIGTSNPAFFIGRTDAVSQMQIGVNAYYDGTWKHFATNAATRYYQGGGEHYWDSAVSASANSTVAWVERMRITSDTAAFLRMSSGTGGIQFNGDTAAANALDDYEEGTWTMQLTFGGASVGVTYAENTGTYTKIGRQVTLNGYLALSNKGSSTGIAIVTGLPFTIGSTIPFYSAPTLRCANISYVGMLTGYGAITQQNIILQQVTEAGVISDLSNTSFSNTSDVLLSFTYFV